jgi:hypothetical protein
MIKEMFGAVLQKVLYDTRALEYEQSVLRFFLKIILEKRSKNRGLLKAYSNLITDSAFLSTDK